MRSTRKSVGLCIAVAWHPLQYQLVKRLHLQACAIEKRLQTGNWACWLGQRWAQLLQQYLRVGAYGQAAGIELLRQLQGSDKGQQLGLVVAAAAMQIF